jgi:hypothetical protein
MAVQYLWKKGDRALGPFSLDDMRKMVRNGSLGRFQSVSRDAGTSWAPASTFTEIWESTELTTLPSSPTSAAPSPTSSATPTTIFVPATVGAGPEDAPLAELGQPRAGHTSGRGLALAGFITTTAAIVFTLAPFFIWITRHEASYAAVPLAFLFLVASITGLILSAIAMRRRPSGFATTGLVVGICGAALGLVTSIGWLVSNDPREDWIRRLTATAEADVQLARRDFTGSLKRYREHAPDDDHAAALERVTKDLMLLTDAHKRLLIAAASTPRFRKHFLKLDELRTAFTSFGEAVKLQDNKTPQQAIDDVGRSGTTLKELLDLSELHHTRQLSIEAAQAKFRDY